VKKLLSVSETAEFLLVVIDAKEGAIELYKKMEFINFFDKEYKLTCCYS
jgi:hypothetical protein